jgi:hypothetical protein
MVRAVIYWIRVNHVMGFCNLVELYDAKQYFCQTIKLCKKGSLRWKLSDYQHVNILFRPKGFL